MVKLASGKKVELRPLTFLEKIPIKDVYYGMAFAKDTMNVPIFSLAVKALMQINFKEAELEGWEDAEIIEAGSWILDKSNIPYMRTRENTTAELYRIISDDVSKLTAADTEKLALVRELSDLRLDFDSIDTLFHQH